VTEQIPSLEIVHSADVATISFGSPILSRAVLAELGDALRSLADHPTPPPVVLCSAHPTIFLAGAHLGEIAELDHSSCVAYARLGRSTVAALGSHPAPTVAAVGGSCSGGGFDLVMACDAIVAAPDAVFSHPGIRRGLVTGWGGTESISHAAGGVATRRALLEATGLESGELFDLGAIRSVAADPVREARDIAVRLARLDPSRLAVWRRLRGPNFVDRFRAFVVEKS
jgi:enoyl-CoA hydratase/carnithine racemase